MPLDNRLMCIFPLPRLLLPRDDNEAGLIYVDGQLVSQPVHKNYPGSNYCGGPNDDNLADLVIHLPDHIGSTLTLRIAADINSGLSSCHNKVMSFDCVSRVLTPNFKLLHAAAADESFAVDDVLISPFIRTWPVLDTFTIVRTT